MTNTEIGEKLYTIEEFLALDLPDDQDYELIGGQLVAKPGTTNFRHGVIVVQIAHYLESFGGISSAKPLGLVASGISTTLGEPLNSGKTFPKPDVCFVAADRLPADIKKIDILEVAPDLVVEVNSPSDTEERKFDKLQAYQDAGVKLIWSVHVLGEYVLVFQSDKPNRPTAVTLDQELDGGSVLPGFRLPVKDIFK
jgi:Uma2 family endonuclease